MQYRNLVEQLNEATEFSSADLEFLLRFSKKCPFSMHFARFCDEELPDKYDNNFFAYSGQPTEREFQKAVSYQKSRSDTFIKLMGKKPLSNPFGLSESVTLTMKLNEDFHTWNYRDDLMFHKPSLDELEEHEVSQYGLVYGESFARRNIKRMYEKLAYHGAYMNHELVGSCYTFVASNGYVCLDGLLVDFEHRQQGIATALLAHVAEMAEGHVLYLHADADGAPRKFYEELGFQEVDQTFEYLCPDLLLSPPEHQN